MGRVKHSPRPRSGWEGSASPMSPLWLGELAQDGAMEDQTARCEQSTILPCIPLHRPRNPAPSPLAGTREKQDTGNRIPVDVFQPAASAPSSARQLLSTSPSTTEGPNYAAVIMQPDYLTASCDQGENLSPAGLVFFPALTYKSIKTPIKESFILSPQSRQPSRGLGAN